MKKTPTQILIAYFERCIKKDVPAFLFAEESTLSEDCNMLIVCGDIDGQVCGLFTLMGNNLREELQSIAEFAASSMTEEYDSAD